MVHAYSQANKYFLDLVKDGGGEKLWFLVQTLFFFFLRCKVQLAICIENHTSPHLLSARYCEYLLSFLRQTLSQR